MLLQYKIMRVKATWFSWKFAPGHYELIYGDLNVPSSGFFYRPGYRSDNMRDILHAVWFLSGSAFHVELTQRQQLILEDIKNVSQREAAAFMDQAHCS